MNTPQSPDDTSPLPSVDAFVGQVVLRLKHLRDPEQRGDRTDAAASEALTLASMLFNALAGWARDHVIGRTIKGIPRVAYAPGTKRERELGEERPWDDLGLQALGSKYNFDDRTINKKIVVELISGASRVLGHQLSSQLSEAFEGMLFGQQYELVHPCKPRLKGPAHELWHLRFKACRYVAFLRGMGCSKENALEQVSEAFGLNESERSAGPERLLKWEQRLRKHFDEFLLSDAVESAFNLGGWYRHLKNRTDLDPFEKDELKSLKNRYGKSAMKSAGREFRKKSPVERHD